MESASLGGRIAVIVLCGLVLAGDLFFAFNMARSIFG